MLPESEGSTGFNPGKGLHIKVNSSTEEDLDPLTPCSCVNPMTVYGTLRVLYLCLTWKSLTRPALCFNRAECGKRHCLRSVPTDLRAANHFWQPEHLSGVKRYLTEVQLLWKVQLECMNMGH